jgi:uncharacterized protein (DUF2267 family)
MNEALNNIFGQTMEKTHLWLVAVMKELHWTDEHKAYLALRAVLHTLRDRLTVEEAADLAAQLPMLVRGLYFEGWNPRGKPVKERHEEGFFYHVMTYFNFDEKIEPREVVRAVFAVIRTHVSIGEIDDIKHILPGELRALWV